MKSTWLRTLALVGGVGLSIASTLSPGEGEPDPDSCADPDTTGASAVTIGRAGDPFEALAPGAAAEIITGTQGADMLPVRLRVEGLESACVSQLTEVRYCPPETDCSGGGAESVVTSAVALRLYPDGSDGDARATMDHFLILDRSPASGGELVVTTTAGGATDSVALAVD
jgi:hypothetical protein